MQIRLYEDGNEYIPEEKNETAEKVEMWYDRHYKHWVIYPVDAEGNQIAEARYGFGKKEAAEIKKDIEASYNI